MSEIRRHSEGRETGAPKFPGTLDIIKINGRWAQVLSSISMRPDAPNPVRYLDDKAGEFIDFTQYELAHEYDSHVMAVINQDPEAFTPEELENIHWGPEQANTPRLKKLVTVFGEYKKRDE